MPVPPSHEGTVVRVDARAAEVDLDGEVVQARLRGRLFEERGEDQVPLAVGDRVRVHRERDEVAIEEILPRRNLLARRSAGQEVRRQLVAANVDQVVVVASFGNPPFSSVTTDRILAGAHFCDVPAVLLLNKTDLAEAELRDAVVATYRAAGYPVLLTSARLGEGIDEVRELLRDRISVLSGLSGAGKSTLLNAIEPGLGLRTREVSKSLKSGRHTTTYARLFPLAMGGGVIDTPGVRVFRLYGIPPGELRLHFPELAELGADCRYPTCLHRGEPDCAVLAAREAGRFPESRYRSYLEILEELEKVYGGAGPA